MKYNEDIILQQLRSGGPEVHHAVESIYRKQRSKIINFVKQNSGSVEDGKDVLQESITAAYINIKSGKFRGDSPLDAYVFIIARNIWYKTLKKRNRHLKAVDNLETYETIEVEQQLENQNEMIALFSGLGEKCKKLLLLSFFYNYKNEEIAEKLGFRSGQVIRNKKYKCLKKLKEMISANPSLMSIFYK